MPGSLAVRENTVHHLLGARETAMTAAQFETLDAPEAESVLCWRFEQLVAAGFAAGEAAILASHVEIDLHCATDLVDRGCPHETALRILL